jgi:hypothetical protein
MLLFVIFSVFEGLGYSTSATGMGGNSVAIRDCALQANQASLSYNKGITFSYTFNKEFSVLENHRANLAWNGIGIGIISRQTPDPESGSDLSSEMEARIAHGISLSDQLRLGYSINGYHLWMREFGSANTGGFDLSLLGEVYENWVVGINAHNLNRPKIGKENPYTLPWSLSVGVSYNPYPGVVSHLAFTREEDYPLEIHFGQSFQIGDQLILQAGIQNEPVRLSFGIVVNAGWLSFQYSARNHRQLPLSHWVGVSYR